MKKRLLFLFSLLLLVGNVVAQVDYTPINTGAKTRTNRMVGSISVGGDTYTLPTGARNAYTDLTSTKTFTVTAGETVILAMTQSAGSWMNAFVYVDMDNNGFTAGVESNGYTPTGDLVSFSFYSNSSTDDASGYNSAGTRVTGDNRSTLTLPSWTVPADLTPGEYRIRFKYDWNKIEPAGVSGSYFGNTFMGHGGEIIDAKLIVTDEVVDPTPEPSALPDPIEASAFVAGKVYLIKNVAANKFLYNEGNAIKVGNIADLTNIPSNCLFTAVEVTGGVALKASNGEYLPSTGASGAALTTAANPSAVNLSAKGGTYPSTTLNVLVGAAGNYWNIAGGAGGSELCFYNDVNDPNGVWEFRIMGDASTEGPDPETPIVITDVAQLSNAKCYTLVSSDTGRGGMYALADKVDMCGVTYSAGTDACHSVARNNADPKQQFAFVAYEGKYYLYSVSEKKFVMKSGDTNALVGEAPFEHVVVEKVGENTFALQANGTHYFTASPGWCSNASRGTCVQSTLNSHSSDDGWDDGAWYTITEVADFDPTEALALLNPSAPVGPSEAEVTALLEKATQALALDGVGYPVEAKRETLNTVKAALETEVTQDNYNALVATLTEYVATTDVKMPESGKAYTFVSKQKNGTLYYLTYTSSGVVTTTNVAEATPFVCKTLENGKFVFVNNAGKYMIWRGNTAGLNGAKGYYDSYDTSAAAWCDIELTKVIEGANVAAGNEEKLFGCMFFKGRREASGTNQFNYTVIKSDGIYDQASVPFFNDNFSSAMMLVEATYPNKPELKAADGLDVAAIATYSAPFATVVPEGVTAWYAQSEGGDYVSMTEVEGAIPANTGVVLTSETTGTVTMVPAAAEALATVSGNLLSAAAAAGNCDVEATTNAYVIGKADGVVAFYPLSATNRTIAQGKSFLVLPTASPVVKMNFGGESTAIETVEKVDANAPIYDLSGRRVVNMTNGGVYIQNGKKFIVK